MQQIVMQPISSGTAATSGLLGKTVTLSEKSQAIVKAMSDALSRRIIYSAISTGKSVEEISAEINIPLSTTYKRVHRLCKSGVLVVERRIITENGRKHAVYRSAFRDVKIRLEPGEVQVQVTENVNSMDRLYGT